MGKLRHRATHRLCIELLEYHSCTEFMKQALSLHIVGPDEPCGVSQSGILWFYNTVVTNRLKLRIKASALSPREVIFTCCRTQM